MYVSILDKSLRKQIVFDVINKARQITQISNNYNNISFEPSQNWESTTTSERILVVTLSSPYYTIPQELKTVKIRLYLNRGYWQ